MNPVEPNSGKEKPARMGFDYFHLVNFHCWSCGIQVVINVRYHHNMLCPDCNPDYLQGIDEN